MFLHEDDEFGALIRIVADQRRVSPGIVEKDYWVTHSLWALQQTDLEVFFQGGTALSKVFEIIPWFSEDLDLKLEPGSNTDLPAISRSSESPAAIDKRRHYFVSLLPLLVIPHARVTLERGDEKWRNAEFRVNYPGQFLDTLQESMSPHVALEVGVHAWTPPTLPCTFRAFVHDLVDDQGRLGDYADNCPTDVACVHPYATLVDKRDVITRRYPRTPYRPETFVRHYEDAAHIITHLDNLPQLSTDADTSGAIDKMLGRINADDPAFVLGDADRRAGLDDAHRKIQPMFWGARLELDECCDTIRSWLVETPPHQEV